MTENTLKPGDRVLELAGVTQSAAALTGAITGAITSWLTDSRWTTVFVALLTGSILGWLVGFVVARIFYKSAGQTVVVKVGPSAIPQAIRAGLAGSISAGVIIAGVAIFLLSAHAGTVLLVSIGCGLVIGSGLALLGSLA